MNRPLLELAKDIVLGSPVPAAAPPEGPVRVRCIYCHHDSVRESAPDVCPTCGDVRICVTTPQDEYRALRDRLQQEREQSEWRKLRDRLAGTR